MCWFSRWTENIISKSKYKGSGSHLDTLAICGNEYYNDIVYDWKKVTCPKCLKRKK